MRTPSLYAIGLLLVSAPAAAEGFLTLDRGDSASRLGFEASYARLDLPGLFGGDVDAFRFEGHAHYLTPQGLGGYGAMQIVHGSNDNDSATGIGNAEVGALYVTRLQRNGELVVRAGVTLPTANGDGIDGGDEAVVNLVGQTARITDTFQIIPEGFALRIAVSPTIKQGQFFARIDAGLDISLSSALADEPDPVIRINLGGGIDLGAVAVTAELANLVSTDGDLEDQVGNAAAFGVRARAGGVQPYGGIVLPLDDSYDGVDFVLTAGVDIALGGPER